MFVNFLRQCFNLYSTNLVNPIAILHIYMPMVTGVVKGGGNKGTMPPVDRRVKKKGGGERYGIGLMLLPITYP